MSDTVHENLPYGTGNQVIGIEMLAMEDRELEQRFLEEYVTFYFFVVMGASLYFFVFLICFLKSLFFN
jgi:hypothetical protein